MASDISLTRAQRLALIDLTENASLSSRTQLRLSSGKKINSVIDDSVNYFKAKSLDDTGKDFANLREGIGQAISQLEVTLEAISGLESIVGQIRGIIDAARSQSTAERTLANNAIRNLGAQFYQLVKDASYGGANLIDNTALGRTVRFGTRSASVLQLPGLDFIKAVPQDRRVFTNVNVFSVTAGTARFMLSRFFVGSALFAGANSGLTVIGANNSNIVGVDVAIERLDNAIARLRGHAQSLGSNVAILQAREEFTDKYVTMHVVGAEKYTLANLNEEGANLVALQTRQQLGIQALAVAGQQQRAILTLLQ